MAIYYKSGDTQKTWLNTEKATEASKYEEAAVQIGKLVATKQAQYGDSFGNAGKILQVLYPDGVKPEQYGDMLAITRVIDKLFRIANGDQGNESAWQDITGYGILSVVKNDDKSNQGDHICPRCGGNLKLDKIIEPSVYYCPECERRGWSY